MSENSGCGVCRYCIDPRHDITDLRMMRWSLQATTADHLKLLHLHDLPIEVRNTFCRPGDIASCRQRLAWSSFASLVDSRVSTEARLASTLEMGLIPAGALQLLSTCWAIMCKAPRETNRNFLPCSFLPSSGEQMSQSFTSQYGCALPRHLQSTRSYSSSLRTSS